VIPSSAVAFNCCPRATAAGSTVTGSNCADYLHQVFEPTARAIEGLEKALAGLGLLEEALVMDLRRPQDYFRRVWSTNFRATDLATVGGHTGLVADRGDR
jgi:hypothetical protein